MTEPTRWDPDALRRRINDYAPYVGARIEVTHVAADAGEIRVRMPLVPENENLVGTQFGGSLYAMVDPHLMILLAHRLGPDYTVWDRSAAIDFLRPGRGTVHSTIRILDEDVDRIRKATADGSKHHPEWTLDIVDHAGEVVARVRKVLYVRRRPGGGGAEAR